MAVSAEEASLERQVLGQLADIGRRIIELEAERSALQRVLARVRMQNTAAQDVTRRNSFERIMIESTILAKLRKSEGDVRASDLYQEVRFIKNRGLKGTTFRSHLHRMKQKGQIEPSDKIGFWRLVRESPP
jgi:hypothetical protein